ncbi:MAG: PilZ domain-containing protein [Myxococcaceae bacterium]|nr:PilZ domain-containing protein [Myxococcaceae bacterium]
MERLARDNRRMPRLVVELIAHRADDGRIIVDRVLNLSVTGAMLLTQHPIARGRFFTVRLGDVEPRVELGCEVVWAKASTRWPGTEAGVKFKGITEASAAQLELLMTKLLASKQGRRSSMRFNVTLPAIWRSAGASTMYPIELIDLSLGGAMISGDTVPEYGDRGLLSLDLGEGVIAASANVVWRDIHRVPNASGLSFDPGPEVSEFVAKIVRAQLLERGEATVKEELASLFDGLDAEKTERVKLLVPPKK